MQHFAKYIVFFFLVVMVYKQVLQCQMLITNATYTLLNNSDDESDEQKENNDSFEELIFTCLTAYSDFKHNIKAPSKQETSTLYKMNFDWETPFLEVQTPPPNYE